MLGRDASAPLSSRADLAVLGDSARACLVVQRRQCEDWFVVVAHRRSATSARAWIEAHYEQVRWRSPVECTALVGRMRREQLFRALLTFPWVGSNSRRTDGGLLRQASR